MSFHLVLAGKSIELKEFEGLDELVQYLRTYLPEFTSPVAVLVYEGKRHPVLGRGSSERYLRFSQAGLLGDSTSQDIPLFVETAEPLQEICWYGKTPEQPVSDGPDTEYHALTEEGLK